MLDLKSKLALYKSSQKETKNIVPKEENDICKGMNGKVCESSLGSYYMIQSVYPLSHIHGGYELGDALKCNLRALQQACGDDGKELDIQQLIFLDTETTGLSAGTGTVAFLIGAGFFAGDEFIVKQYFMRDYYEEPALLASLNELFSVYKGTVTFNGKAYDWNLLQSRFIFNRIRTALANPCQLDLLYPSRNIWKMKYSSCRLSAIEENILGEVRDDDIPGAMIPEAFFKYLESRDTADMLKVLDHNRRDILSMVSLMVRLCRMLENPFTETDGEVELFGVGRIFEKSLKRQQEMQKERIQMVDCYQTCAKSDNKAVKNMASRRLAEIYKRKKEYDKAVEQWNAMLEDSGPLNIYPIIELAKHYEHRERNYQQAIRLVEYAMDGIRKTGINNSVYMKNLRKRFDRLKRKSAAAGNIPRQE